ncbi:hypothetical protein [Leadbetterella byssophila]|uniref:hypothetical protein n=1 Tax=Leadbetterella byssophila TaxID=316068 RepID=UPI0039A2852C
MLSGNLPAGFIGEEPDPQDLKGAQLTTQAIAKKYPLALPMTNYLDGTWHMLDGQLLGYQTKNQ